MNSGARHTPGGGTQIPTEDNVVRFPRDWIGPREELVPFGEGASGEGPLESPESTHDFWGDGASAAPVKPVLPRPDACAESGASASAGVRGRGSAHREGRFAWLVAAMTLLLVAGVSGLSQLVPAATTGRPAARTSHPPGTVPTSPAARTASLAAMATKLGREARANGSNHPTQMRHRVRPQRRSPRAHRQRAQRSANIEQVRYSPPARAGTGTGTGSGSGATVSTSPSASSSSASPPTGSASSAGAASSQPAIGATGSLAPGSSRDG